MFAKQTLSSASLVVVLGGMSRLAFAEPGVPAPDSGGAPPKKDTGTFQIGAGYITDDGFVAKAVISQSNLFGTGDLLAMSAMVSERRQLFDLKFVDPHWLDTDTALGFDLTNDGRQLPGFWRSSAGFSTTLQQPLGDHAIGFLSYRLEDVSVQLDQPVAIARGGPGPAPLGDGILSGLRAGLSYANVDHPQMPMRGTMLGAAIEVDDPMLGSDYQLVRLDAWASTHQAIGPFTLHLGTTMHSVESRDFVPLADRLFLDGSSDIRGYAPGSIGPLSGGTFELTGRAELEAPLIASIGLSAEGFADAGGLFDGSGIGQVGRSVGFGLIWRSPIGPLCFDYAFPLTGGPPRFVFGVRLF